MDTMTENNTESVSSVYTTQADTTKIKNSIHRNSIMTSTFKLINVSITYGCIHSDPAGYS